MEDSLPFVIAFGGQIKGDIVLRLAFFIQASNLDGLAFEDGSDLANAFGVFECENLDGPRSLPQGNLIVDMPLRNPLSSRGYEPTRICCHCRHGRRQHRFLPHR